MSQQTNTSKKRLIIVIGIILLIIIIAAFLIKKIVNQPQSKDTGLIKGIYIPNWTVYRAGSGKFPNWSWGQTSLKFNVPSELDFINYSFLLFDKDGNLNWGLVNGTPIPALIDENNKELVGYDPIAMNAFKDLYVPLKFISLGGYNFSNKDAGQSTYGIYEDIANNPTTTNTLANNLVTFCKNYSLVGIDIDWEYPQDKNLFTTFIKNLYSVISSHGLKLTVAISTNPTQMEKSYDFKALDQYVDWYNLMSYDISGNFGSVSDTSVFGANTDLSYIQTAINYLQSQNILSKVCLGLASYGRCTRFTQEQIGNDLIPLGKKFTPIDENKCDTYTDSNKACYAGYHPQCFAGPFTKQIGYLSYYEILDLLNISNSKPTVDQKTSSAYVVIKKQGDVTKLENAPYLGISFDTPETIAMKVNYASQNKMKGAFIWQLADDDFLNDYPITNAMIMSAKGKQFAPNSSRKPYDQGICGIKWNDIVTTGVNTCDQQFENPGTSSYPCYGLPTCQAIIPDTCQIGSKNQILQQGKGISDLITNNCGNSVLWTGALYAAQFNNNILKPGRLIYCDGDQNAKIFNPDCPVYSNGQYNDVGSCIANSLNQLNNLQQAYLCLDKDINNCKDIACPPPSNWKDECLSYSDDKCTTTNKITTFPDLSKKSATLCQRTIGILGNEGKSYGCDGGKVANTNVYSKIPACSDSIKENCFTPCNDQGNPFGCTPATDGQGQPNYQCKKLSENTCNFCCGKK